MRNFYIGNHFAIETTTMTHVSMHPTDRHCAHIEQQSMDIRTSDE